MNSRQISIGVVIPNYNDSNLIERSINSVLKQSVKVDELIIVDDCSTDNSISVINIIASKNPNIKIIRNSKNIGTMSSLNIGLENISTDYVLFLSANDYIIKGLIEEVKLTLAYQKSGIWSALIIKEGISEGKIYRSPIVLSRRGYITPEQCILRLNSIGSWFTGTTMFFEVEAIRELGGFNISLQGLGDMYAAMIIAANRGAYFCPKPYGVVGNHAGGLLRETLKNNDSIKKIICFAVKDGVKRCPNLFTDKFIKRFSNRIKYSAKKSELEGNSIIKLFLDFLLLIKYRHKDIFLMIYFRYLKKY